MKVLIIEDEAPAANKLAKMIMNISSDIEIIERLDSVESSIDYLKINTDLDLIFMDIQLADGLSLDIFSKVKVSSPVIFTTAFDQYTLKAFKVNSVDYLLKPIDVNELKDSIQKYRELYTKKSPDLSSQLLDIAKLIQQSKNKDRLLIRRGLQLSYLKMDDIAFCFADGKFCYAVDKQGNKFLLEINLSRLGEILPLISFFRINRHLIINITSINKVNTWVGGRLKVELSINTNIDTMVSRERVIEFKEWLGQ